MASSKDEPQSLKIIVKGRVRVETEEGDCIRELQRGQAFGEWDILDFHSCVSNSLRPPSCLACSVVDTRSRFWTCRGLPAVAALDVWLTSCCCWRCAVVAMVRRPIATRCVAMSHVHCVEIDRETFQTVVAKYPGDLREELGREMEERAELRRTESDCSVRNLRHLLRWKDFVRKVQARCLF